MERGCVWIIGIGDVDKVAQLVAAQLKPYGLAVKGQKWPKGQSQAWVASAQEAAAAAGHVVLVISTDADYHDPQTRRELALFRLLLQSQLNRPVGGFVILTDASQSPLDPLSVNGTSILGDWEQVSGNQWPAKVVARLHAPRQLNWPFKLALFTQEQLGVWLSVSPLPGHVMQGCLVGVNGTGCEINFHAVGTAGGLPEKSVNEYELRGLVFDVGAKSFDAWALQNMIGADQAYYVRLVGEPDALAIGELPAGQLSEVDIVNLA